MADIADGATVLVGGFGSAGQPVALVEALLEGGARELTVVSNNAGGGDEGLAALIRDGRVRKVICSFPRLARVVAADIPPGSFVNLGIGLPTRISNHLPPERGVMLHTENGTLGMGPEAQGEAIDPDLVNAGKAPVTELPGASYFHHADSFAMVRGGRPKLVRTCTYPLTGLGCVSRVYTDLAVFLIQPGRVVVRYLFGIDFAKLTTLVGVPLVDGTRRAAS